MATTHLRINSREELMEYAMRALGHPVVQINVDKTQLEDRIDDALDLFWEYHYAGTELVFINYQVTADDKARGFVALPEDVVAVLGSGSLTGSVNTHIANLNNLQQQMYLTDIMSVRRIMGGGGLGQYYMTQNSLSTFNNTFSSPKRLDFNHHHGKLTVQGGWNNIEVGSWISVEGYQKVRPDDHGVAFNDRWVKKYVTAQFKKQWGDNLIKYGGGTLPGGVVINAEQLYNDGRADCLALEEELRNNYQLPVDFYMG